MLIHPIEHRPLSIAEYAAIQQFPPDWVFAGGLPQQYIQLGNAVPLGLGYAIGLALRAAGRKRHRIPGCGKVVCADPSLLDRLAKRPKTVLNPTRMRKVRELKPARAWLGGETREEILKFVELYPDLDRGHASD
jgi:DNA (cytosine-5)-methyltransferase 1